MAAHVDGDADPVALLRRGDETAVRELIARAQVEARRGCPVSAAA
jgi:hypothetical protein